MPRSSIVPPRLTVEGGATGSSSYAELLSALLFVDVLGVRPSLAESLRLPVKEHRSAD
jgi:hypothetical protein